MLGKLNIKTPTTTVVYCFLIPFFIFSKHSAYIWQLFQQKWQIFKLEKKRLPAPTRTVLCK